ncbi:MAG: hypothetical protein MJ197_09290 [Bacteroidales bacterium]|nr:hypothetical protein [Bacteroidales bacterium]
MDVETRCTTSLHENQQHSKQMTSICDMQGWLSVVVGGLKRAITHFANENNIGKWYQRQLWGRKIL